MTEPFATVTDLKNGWRELSKEEESRAAYALESASTYIAGRMKNKHVEIRETDGAQRAILNMVTVNVVRRALGELNPVNETSDWSINTGAYSQTFTHAQMSNDFWLTKEEKKLLGIFGARVSTISPIGA